MKQLWTNDLFCGGGGMGLGFKNAGFRLAGAWDFDKYAVESYGNNVSPKVKQADITQMKWDELPKADVWTFGAPCQAFSIAGKQLGMTFKCPSCGYEEIFEGENIIDKNTPCSECGEQSKPKDPRGILFFEVMRLLKETNAADPNRLPPVIMLENVKGISKFLDVVKFEYQKRGYRMTYTLYNSKYWGVPQNRERYFIVGIRETIRKAFQFPRQQTDFIPKLSSVLESEVDEKFYIDDLKAAKIIEQAKEKVSLKGTHPCITPGRVDRRQQGRRAKDNEEEMFTLTSQDLHGVIVDASQEKREGKYRLYDENSPTLNARDYKDPRMVIDSSDGAIQRYDVKIPVRVRKHEVNVEELRNLLRNCKKKTELTNKQLAEHFEKPLTEVEHWFRTDNCFSIPDPNIWEELKHVLEIPTDEYDAQVTEFIEVPGVYDQANRVYGVDGIAPTVTTQGEIKVIGRLGMKGHDIIRRVYDTDGIAPTLTTSEGGHRQPKILTKYRVRKLTPREYARLQGFPDSYKQVVSNSQFYKQMGNAVTVNVAQAIAEKIKEFLEKL